MGSDEVSAVSLCHSISLVPQKFFFKVSPFSKP